MLIRLSGRLLIKLEDVSAIELDNESSSSASKVLVGTQWVRLDASRTSLLKRHLRAAQPELFTEQEVKEPWK